MHEPHLHSSFTLEVGEGRLRVLLVPRVSHPPHGAGVRDLHRCIVEQGIQHGVDREQLKGVLAAWRLGEAGPWVIAEGTAPSAGRPAGLDRIPPPPRSGRDPVELLPLFVRRGDRLFRPIAALPSHPGVDVFGAPIPIPESAAGETPRPGGGIAIEEDGTWVARATGFLHTAEGEVRVVRTLLHPHRLPPGSSQWPGDAKIEGSIAAETVLEIGGNLWISDEVEAGSCLRAGEDLRIDGAVKGRGSVRLEAGGRIQLGDVAGALITAGGQVVLTGEVRDCRIRTRSRCVAEEGSVVVDGSVEAVGGIDLREVRSDGSRHPMLSVGRASWINEEMRSIESEIHRWTQYREKLLTDFRRDNEALLERRAKLWQQRGGVQESFLRAEEEVQDELARVDQRISRLKGRLEGLASDRCTDARAVVLLRGAADPETRVIVRGRSYAPTGRALERVAIGIFGEGRTLCAIPSALYLTSEVS